MSEPGVEHRGAARAAAARPPFWFRPALRYAGAAASVALALGFNQLFQPVTHHFHSPLFFAAVMLSAWFGGLGPGLLTILLSALALDYFFISPETALFSDWAGLTKLGMFVLVALLISVLTTASRWLEERWRRRVDELSEADRRKNDFLAMLAHELRNPLAPIRNALDIMRLSEADPATAAQARELIERQVRQLSMLVNDLLDVSRVQQGKVQLRREPLDVAAAVSGALRTARPAIAARAHELILSLPPEPLIVDADPIRLEQVLTNLIHNAVKYTEPGGIIRITVRQQQDMVEVRVRDTGIGITSDMLPRVFDLFTQAENALGRSQGGLGIGLTLVRRLVEMHGGSVYAYSAGLGQGSEFTTRLPLAADHGGARHADQARSGRPLAVGGDSPKTWGSSVEGGEAQHP
jgi:signal transduction histidine kinase